MSELSYADLRRAYREDLSGRFPWLDPFRLDLLADGFARTELANRWEDRAGLIQARGRIAAVSHAKEAWARRIEDAVADLEREAADRDRHARETGADDDRWASIKAEINRPIRAAAMLRALVEVGAIRPGGSIDDRGYVLDAWVEAVDAAGLIDRSAEEVLRLDESDRRIARVLVDAGLVRPWVCEGYDDLGEPLRDPPGDPDWAGQVGLPTGPGRPGELVSGDQWDLPPEWRNGGPDDDDERGRR